MPAASNPRLINDNPFTLNPNAAATKLRPGDMVTLQSGSPNAALAIAVGAPGALSLQMVTPGTAFAPVYTSVTSTHVLGGAGTFITTLTITVSQAGTATKVTGARVRVNIRTVAAISTIVAGAVGTLLSEVHQTINGIADGETGAGGVFNLVVTGTAATGCTVAVQVTYPVASVAVTESYNLP
jgi:hypothetical protein